MLKIIFSFLFFFLILCANVSARNGIYVTAEGGLAYQTQLPSAASVGAVHLNDKQPSAMRVGVGYNHDFFPCFGFGLDLGFGRYGDDTYEFINYEKNVKSSTSEYNILLQWHLTQWDLIGKVGGIRHKIIISKPHKDEDETQINFTTGIGVAYNLNQHWALLASYTHVLGQNTKNFDILSGSTVGLNEYMAGIRYQF